MDSPHEAPKVGERESCLLLGFLQRRGCELGVAGQLVPGESHLRDQGDELLLGAVVQVAVDATTLSVLGVYESSPGRGELDSLQLDLCELFCQQVVLVVRSPRRGPRGGRGRPAPDGRGPR